MRAVWSLWSKPMDTAYRGGWRSLRDHLLSWVLSLETCRRYFDGTQLVVDSPGAAMLVDRLGLAFDTVSVSLDCLAGTDPDLWVMGKLHAYRQQEAPFLHIDSDVYLWNAPPPEHRDADVYAAYPEWRSYGHSYYRCASLKADVRRAGGWLPTELDAYVPAGGQLRAENCAVLGGTHTDFIRFYADQAIRFVDHPDNQHAWHRRRPMMQDTLIFEQHLLSAMLTYHGGRPGSPFREVKLRSMFDGEASCFHGSKAAGFTHLISRAKHDPTLLERLARRVARDFPVHYERVLAIEAGEL